MGAYGYELQEVFFLDSAGPGCGCVCVTSTLHFTMPCSAVPSCLGPWLSPLECLSLTPAISEKHFTGEMSFSCAVWPGSTLALRRGDFTALHGSGCCYHLHFHPPGCTPDPQKLTWRNVLQTLTEMSARFHTFSFFKTTSYCGIISLSQQ